ncbi:hypothetical protein ACCC92_23935 [Mucilaginibacter sp. Mucisp84]|uniref:hypothetical protein n=1 Tax=Mucilaginibacter sp. Mucisp84 TaxID=3243058 RepID=UPI0039A6C9DF
MCIEKECRQWWISLCIDGKIPRGKTGDLIGKAFWDKYHHISGSITDSFYVYGNFDSIRFQAPSSPSRTFRKTDIRAESWKAKPSYGNLNFVGNFTADHLPGAYVSYYFSKDRRYILQALYTNPGMFFDAILFHKDSVNILKVKGIIIEPDY